MTADVRSRPTRTLHGLRLATGDVLNIDNETSRQIRYLEPPFDRDYVQTTGGVAQPAVFWRKRTFERTGGFDTSLRFLSDLDFWIRATPMSFGGWDS